MRKALIIGINHYSSNQIENLSGCNNDASEMHDLLSHHHSRDYPRPNFSCKLLQSNESNHLTRAIVKQEIKTLFEDNETDIALLYFSGHGYESCLGGYLVTQDACQYDEGVSFNDIMIYANRSSIKEIVIILDCCNSGHLGEIITSNSQFISLRNGLSILTSSHSNQLSYEKNDRGVFTQLLCSALRGGNSDILGHVKITHLYEYADSLLGAWEQRPTFKSSASRLSVLREAEPIIDTAIIKKMTSYFKSPNYHFKLSPVFVPSQGHGYVDKEKIYKDLQKMAQASLVRPVNAEHMYYAAINHKSCALTAYGRQYWHLVKKNLL